MPKKVSRKSIARLVCFASLFCLVLGLTGFTIQSTDTFPQPTLMLDTTDESTNKAHLITVNGIINPVVQRYVTYALKKAYEEESKLIVITLNTPGGLFTSTRKIVGQLLMAPVPIVVYVTPAGSQAASAGTFITAAANFAVMAPGTNIGAATPIAATGKDLEATLASKATNDAAAFIRSIAKQRDRNVEELERTVLEATSFDAREAMELRVIDFIAKDINDLLKKLDGRAVSTAKGHHIIQVDGLVIDNVSMSLIDRFFNILADPNISFILFTIGAFAIIIEFFNPGMVFPGVIGSILLVLSFLSFGNLPVNWAATSFLVLAIVLIVAEFYISGFGILGVGGIVSFILGALLLFSQFGPVSPTMPSLSVSLWVLVPIAVCITVIGTYGYFTALQSHRAPPPLAISPLIGMDGHATTDLAPHGIIRIQGSLWTAVTSEIVPIPSGESVKIVAVEGLTLKVVRAKGESEVFDKPEPRQ